MLNNISNYFSNFNRAENYINRKECLAKLKPAISFVAMTGLTTGALLAFCIYKGKDVQIFSSSVNQFINKNIVPLRNTSLLIGGLSFAASFVKTSVLIERDSLDFFRNLYTNSKL